MSTRTHKPTHKPRGAATVADQWISAREAREMNKAADKVLARHGAPTGGYGAFRFRNKMNKKK